MNSATEEDLLQSLKVSSAHIERMYDRMYDEGGKTQEL
jgi:hypothetical protein